MWIRFHQCFFLNLKFYNHCFCFNIFFKAANLVPGIAAPDGGAARQLQGDVAVGAGGGEELVDAGPRELDAGLGERVPGVQQPHVPQDPVKLPVVVGKMLHQSALG